MSLEVFIGHLNRLKDNDIVDKAAISSFAALRNVLNDGKIMFLPKELTQATLHICMIKLEKNYSEECKVELLSFLLAYLKTLKNYQIKFKDEAEYSRVAHLIFICLSLSKDMKHLELRIQCIRVLKCLLDLFEDKIAPFLPGISCSLVRLITTAHQTSLIDESLDALKILLFYSLSSETDEKTKQKIDKLLENLGCLLLLDDRIIELYRSFCRYIMEEQVCLLDKTKIMMLEDLFKSRNYWYSTSVHSALKEELHTRLFSHIQSLQDFSLCTIKTIDTLSIIKGYIGMFGEDLDFQIYISALLEGLVRIMNLESTSTSSSSITVPLVNNSKDFSIKTKENIDAKAAVNEICALVSGLYPCAYFVDWFEQDSNRWSCKHRIYLLSSVIPQNCTVFSLALLDHDQSDCKVAHILEYIVSEEKYSENTAEVIELIQKLFSHSCELIPEFLPRFLYPLLSLYSSNDQTVKFKCWNCLNCIAEKASYTSVASLIVNNLDYITNSLSLDLNFGGEIEKMTQVLVGIVSIGRKETLFNLKGSFEILFDKLAYYSPSPLISFQILSSFRILVESLYSDHTIEHCAKKIVQRSTIYGKKCFHEFLEEYSKKETLPDEGQEERKVSDEEAIVLKITAQTLNQLLSDWESVRTESLKLLTHCIAKLSLVDSKELCPLLFKYWGIMVNRLKDNDASVKFQCLELLSSLVQFQPQFVSEKIPRDIVPVLTNQMKSLLKSITGRIYNSTAFSSSISFQVCIIEFYQLSVKSLNLKQDQLRDLILSVIPYLDAHLPLDLQKAAMNFFHEALAIDKGLAWFWLSTRFTKLAQSLHGYIVIGDNKDYESNISSLLSTQ